MHKNDLKLLDNDFMYKFKNYYKDSLFKQDQSTLNIFFCVLFVTALFGFIGFGGFYIYGIIVGFIASFSVLLVGIKSLFLNKIFMKQSLKYLIIALVPIVFYLLMFSLILGFSDTNIFSTNINYLIVHSKFAFMDSLIFSKESFKNNFDLVMVLIVIASCAIGLCYCFIRNMIITKYCLLLDKILTPTTYKSYEKLCKEAPKNDYVNNVYFQRAIMIKDGLNEQEE